MVEITEDSHLKAGEESMLDYVEKVKVVYPRVEEELIDFLNRCKIKGSEVMWFPRCNNVFDKKATKGLRDFKPKPSRRIHKNEKRPHCSFDKRGVPYKKSQEISRY